MKNFLIICGGRSVEHEVSVRSARFIASLIPEDEYCLLVVGIDREGLWHKLSLEELNQREYIDSSARPLVTLAPGREGALLYESEQHNYCPIDIVFPVLHGPNGEDGTIQGWLECLRVPYIGSGVFASAAAMDKHFAKQIFEAQGIPTAPWIAFHDKNQVLSYDQVAQKLDSPILFIKPSFMGSSVGVSKIISPEDYMDKVLHAFRYADKIIVEKAITGSEVECAILGHHTLQASGVGQILLQEGEFYSYEAKYLSANKATVLTSAKITEEQVEQVRQLSIKAFRALGCSGMARVDSFVTDKGVLLNEVNTIPGFTSISLYPQLWEAKGISSRQLIKTLIQCAYEKFDQGAKLLTFPEHLLNSA